MSNGTELAKAYVQIVPSMQGIKGELSGMLGDATDGPSKEAGERAGSNIVSMIGRAIGSSAAIIGSALKKVVSAALTEGAALQQSIGGIETLFGAGGAKSVEDYAEAVGQSVADVQEKYDALKASETKMLEFADKAWQTAGLSANEYMETSTSFAASLLSSLDGDTNAAAEAANKAVIAMSDNANKMGTDMQSIQNAYQGFAKGQYNMLDNLKLGYGGTKSEMERLLADAEKLSGVHYDIDNLSNVYDAIGVIQDKLGITGTTANEAATTFSGSMASMKAAAQNVLGKLAIGEDIMPSVLALGESVKTFLVGNLMPMVKNVLSGLPEVVRTLLDTCLTMAMDLIDYAPELVGMLMNLLIQGFTGITNVLSHIPDMLPDVMTGISNAIQTNLPTLMETGGGMLVMLAKGFERSLPTMIAQGVSLLPTLVESLLAFLPDLISFGLHIIQAISDGIVLALPLLLEALPALIESLMTFVTENLPTIIESGVQILLSLVNGIVQALPMLMNAVPQIIQSIMTMIMANLPTIIIAGIQILFGLIDGIISATPDLIMMIPTIIDSFVIGLFTNLGPIIEGGVKILTSLVDGILSNLGTLITAGLRLVNTIWEQLKQAPAKMLAVGTDIVKGIWNGISNSFTWIKNKISEWVGSVTDFIKKLFKIGSPSKLMAEEVGKFLPEGIAVGVDANAYMVSDSFEAMAKDLDAEAAFSPVIAREVNTDSFSVDGPDGVDSYGSEADRAAELLALIADLLQEFFNAYYAKDDHGWRPDEFIAFIDRRLGRMESMKARGI